MTAERPAPLRGLLHLLGRIGAKNEAMAYSPDLRAARGLGAAASALSLGLLAALVLRLGSWPSFGVVVAGFALTLLFLSGAERLLGAAWLILTFLLGWLLPDGGWILFFQPILAFLALRYLAAHRQALGFDRHLGQMAKSLGEGWKVYLPKDPQAYHLARVLISPEGQTFFLGITPGRAEQKYGTPHVIWPLPSADTVRSLAARDPGAVGNGQHVLWVVKPPQAQEDYETTAEHGVSTVVASPQELAEQLRNWSGMRRNLETPSELGRTVEEEAIQDLESLLPPGWQMRTGTLLASGGDADILLTAPQGERYVVDIKARTDRMNLEAPRGDRAKSWQEVYDQVQHAAQQLRAVPLVWQPRTLDTDIHLVGEAYCLRGDAGYLVEGLEAFEGLEEADRQGTPHEVLGLGTDASREEIQRAYRELAKKYHPDRVGHLGPEFLRIAERRMQAINAAYQNLMR